MNETAFNEVETYRHLAIESWRDNQRLHG